MKEKINEFVDGKIDYESIKPLLNESEYKEYLEDLTKMKKGLSMLKVSSPDFVSKVVKEERKRLVLRYSFAFVTIVVVTFSSILAKDFIVNKQLARNENTTIIRSFKAGPNEQLNTITTINEYDIKVEAKKDYVNTLIENLKQYGSLENTDEKTSVYTFEVKGSSISPFLKVLENEKLNILENNIPSEIDKESTYTIKLQIIEK